jgi:hypothetical protein
VKRLIIGLFVLSLTIGAMALIRDNTFKDDTPNKPDVPARLATDAELVYLQVSAGYPAVLNVWWSPEMDDLGPSRIVKVTAENSALRKATFTCTDYAAESTLFSCFPFPGTHKGDEGVFYIRARDLDALFQQRRAYGVLPSDVFP